MISELLFLASGINVILLALVLIPQKLIPEPRVNKLFTFVLICMFLYSIMVLVRYYFIYRELHNVLIYYLPFEDIVFTLILPAIFLFVKSIMGKPFVFNYKILFHLLPCVVFLTFTVYFIVEYLLLKTQISHVDLNNELIFLNYLICVQVFTYLLLSFRLILIQFKTTNIFNLSTIYYDASWIKPYILFNLIYSTLSIFIYLYFKSEESKIILTQIGIEIQFIYFFVRWAFNVRGTLFKCQVKNNTNKVYMDVVLSQLCIIENYMKEHKPYLNEKCNIQTVAIHTGLTVHQISCTINSTLKKSFSDFVNEYRINDAIEQLLSSKSESITIEAISIDCGFGSKSTFNRAFKKHTNCTPTEYVQKHNNLSFSK